MVSSEKNNPTNNSDTYKQPSSTEAATATILKRDSNPGVSLWILRHFQKHLSFFRTPPVAASGCSKFFRIIHRIAH